MESSRLAGHDWIRAANVNVLTPEKLADMGNAATFYSVCV
jgi:hypothetical protein